MTDRSTQHHWHGRHYDAVHIAGPIPFLNPTTRFVSVHERKKQQQQQQQTRDQEKDKDAPDLPTPGTPEEDDENQQKKQQAFSSQQQQPHTGVYNVWRSRDNRKGRHALALTPSMAEGPHKTPRPTNTFSATLAGIARLVTRYPVWDVSYDVAVVFTLGSVVWVMNGFFVLLPITNPTSSWSGESGWGGGISACVGATIFEVGSILLMLEAVNENRADCFGWALEEALEDSRDNLLQLRREASDECRHHHAEKTAWLSRNRRGNSSASSSSSLRSSSEVPPQASGRRDERKWTWCPSWNELRSHYFRDIGFLACFSQMIGATVFWISGFTGLPQILNVLTVPAMNGIYWLPQVVGGTGFIISSWLFMLETQSKWYVPAPKQLGWQIGFWNLVGALGFTLCGALGFASTNSACEIALTWATFIGSWAFLIGSIVQWYESLDKYPCIVDESVSRRLEREATNGGIDKNNTNTTTNNNNNNSGGIATKEDANNYAGSRV